jgi:hypothetical protein
VADPAAVEDHPVAEIGPLLLRDEPGDLGLDLDRVVLGGPAEPADQPAEMGVHGEPRYSERVAEHHVGGLPADPGKDHQVRHATGDLAVEALDQRLAEPQHGVRLRPEEAGRLEDGFQLPAVGPGEGDGIGIPGEECRRHLVDHLVRGLRRQDRGDQELEGVGEIQLAVCVGMDVGQLTSHAAGPPGARERGLGGVVGGGTGDRGPGGPASRSAADTAGLG